MNIGIWFWVLYVLGLVFGVWSNWPNIRAGGGTFLVYILIGILGYAQFGSAVKG